MKILLHSNQLGLGGTEIALWDYTCGCVDILGHEVVIASGRIDNVAVKDKFLSRFKVLLYSSLSELESFAKEERVDVAYFIAEGRREGAITIPGIKNAIHAVFPFYEPYGDVYAYVSSWAAEKASHGKLPWVPHIVNPFPDSGNLREKLEIPEEAIVFGGYGRSGQFDISFVQQAVREVISTYPSIYFLFMNFTPFASTQKNLIFLPGTADLGTKAAVIDTCDAMLHGRSDGETFGLAVAEFSSRNKPVITYTRSGDMAHVSILKEKGTYYYDFNSLISILCTFKREERDWNAYRDFTPEKVMAKFNTVFLKE